MGEFHAAFLLWDLPRPCCSPAAEPTRVTVPPAARWIGTRGRAPSSRRRPENPGTGAAIGAVGGAVVGAATDPCDLNLGDPFWRDNAADATAIPAAAAMSIVNATATIATADRGKAKT